jgi:hypothetical protein
MASSTIVLSNEKGFGNIFVYFSSGLSTLLLFGIFKSFFEGDLKPAFLYLPFLCVCLMIYLFGKRLNNKYAKLGPTPLTISSSIIPKGIKQQASILINKQNFNCVREIQLKCIAISHSNQTDTSNSHTVFEKQLITEPKYCEQKTTLCFDYEIPLDQPSSGKANSRSSIYWELEFNFRDGMEIVTRSWTIEVK